MKALKSVPPLQRLPEINNTEDNVYVCLDQNPSNWEEFIVLAGTVKKDAKESKCCCYKFDHHTDQYV